MAAKQKQLDERVNRVWRRCSNYGQLEALAGVTDRAAFWREHRTEDAGREALRVLIRERVAKDSTLGA